jgi:hypothetical protein
MTVTEAVVHARFLLRHDADPSHTMHGTLDARTRMAIDKLVTVALDATFCANARELFRKKTFPRIQREEKERSG